MGRSAIMGFIICAAVFWWITSCNKKCYDHRYINTFAGICNVIDDVHNNTCKFSLKICPLPI